jgi:hypothetical protein
VGNFYHFVKNILKKEFFFKESMFLKSHKELPQLLEQEQKSKKFIFVKFLAMGNLKGKS